MSDAWRRLPVAPHGSTLLGISFRPLQAAAFNLDGRRALQELLAYPFPLIRLGAYWNLIEPQPGAFHPEELDWQIDLAERAGKRIILCVGPLKTFGYPEFFAPAHHLKHPFPESALIKPSDYPSLLSAGIEFITRLVERYKGHESILAWQLEHEAVDPLGVEHSWRLAAAYVEQEAQALRQADPGRPLLMNGYLPATWLGRLTQGWSTRDQGDSLALALRLADMVGIDYYPRNALLKLGSRTLYLDGSRSPRGGKAEKELLEWAGNHSHKLLVTEGQAEPWETATTPPNPPGEGMYSCLPEHVIANFNTCKDWFNQQDSLYAYLFWGAEYWLLRKQGGDPTYLQAFERILENGE